jgi:hypothetical protein
MIEARDLQIHVPGLVSYAMSITLLNQKNNYKNMVSTDFHTQSMLKLCPDLSVLVGTNLSIIHVCLFHGSEVPFGL